MALEMPKVSVLMAVYNGDRYLREAIDSILGQTFQDFEFLIINDGSTDRTREVILSYDDPRIRLVDNEHNLGLTQSLNRGLMLAKGEFVARQDGDDISEPERLAKQVAFLEANPEVALLGTWYKKIDAQGSLIGLRELPCDYTQIRWSLLFFCPLVHSAVMLRKPTVVEQLGTYDESFSYSQDYEFWSRIARHFPVANLNEPLVQYRVSPGSMTATYGVKVEDEPFRIRAANMHHLLGLLGWNESKEWEMSEQHLQTMILLFLGTRTGLNLQEAGKSAEALLRLHTGFCHYYKVDPAELKAKHSILCSRLSWQLVEQAQQQFCQNSSIAWQLCLKACQLNPSILLRKSYLRLLCKLLVGPQLAEAIESLIQRAAH